MRLTPRGGADRIEGIDQHGVLRVRVRAAPVDGAANAALVRLLAHALGVPPTAVELERGTTGRVKLVSVQGVDEAALSAFIDGLGRGRG